MNQHNGGPQMPQQPDAPSYQTGGAGPNGPVNTSGHPSSDCYTPMSGQPMAGGQPGAVGQPDAAGQRYGPGQVPPGQVPPPGQPGQAMPPGTPPSQPPKRNWFARHKILTGLLGIVALIVIISALSNGGSSGDEAAASGDDVAATGQAGDEAESGTGGQADDAEQADAPAEEGAPAEEEAAEDVPARDNSSAEATTLGAGTFTVGQDVAPGRYVLEPGAGQSGNVHAATAEDPLVINEILGDAAGLGVPSVTTTLIEGEELEISGLSEVT